MTVDEFFDEPREQSLIKSRIVSKYFSAWARIMIPRARDNRIAYMDLFAGPGRYTDGTPSTPIRVLQTAVKDHNLKRMLVTYFNDKKLANARSLQEAINQIPLINTLSFKPVVAQDEVGEKIAAALQRMALVPTLLFVDPWGYTRDCR